MTKWLVFTDIHFGLRNNEKRHNEECLEFVKWAYKEAKDFGATKSIFMGDWHHNRPSIQTTTLKYSMDAFRHISKNIEKHYHIVGNHDLFYRDRRDVSSVEICREFKNIELVDNITQDGNIALCPWLIGDEHKKIKNIKERYVFGHFELPHFMMNAMVKMPETNKAFNADGFSDNIRMIFSGHFHKRQHQYNKHGNSVWYIGNCFPHTFHDVNDDERGIMLFEEGKEPIFKAWDNAPKYRQYTLTEILNNDTIIDSNTKLRLIIDTDISFVEYMEIKDELLRNNMAREIFIVPKRKSVNESIGFDETIKFKSVDQMVIEQISSMDTTEYDKDKLIDLYGNA